MPANRITLLLMVSIFCAAAWAQQPLLQRQTVLLKRVIEKNHYKPRPANDAFSADVFDRMLDKLDEYKLYFTAKDIAQLSAYRNKIDDEMNGQSWGFTDQLAKLYKARLLKADSIVNKILDKPVSFTANETFNYGPGQQPPQDDVEYALRWNRFVKWRVLSKLMDKYELGELDSVKLTKADILKQEPAVRQGIRERSKKRLAEYIKDPNAATKMIGTLYLQTIATNYDPHTEFMPPEEKADFQDALSSQSMEYGFSLQEEEDGSLKIGDIKPGGAAWKSGNIHDDDKVLQIKPEGEAAIDVKEAGSEGIEKVLKDHANKKMQVVVQSADGKVNTVSLQKQQQRNEENVVKGFVLHGTKNIGYISLPSFYTSWGEEGGSSCANDVAKEIVKLKKENIEGLILDLRYNGGGSVGEAAELAGLFVDIGPMSLIRGKDGKTFVLKDPNRGTIYDGPLELMINGQSASASELVAGTLQDYQRAAIVGSTSFGKATMQGIMPLDTTISEAAANNANAKVSELGYVKTTVGKLFRITNKTAQLTGVVPDVALPDAFEAADYTERSLRFALPSDTIIKPVIYTKGKPVPATTLSTQSGKRIGTEPYFTAIQKAVTAMKAIKDQDVVPLQWEAYEKWRKQGEAPDEPDTRKSTDTKAPYTVQATAFDTELYKLDAYASEINQERITDLSDDPYLTEAYLVMLDYIQSTKP